MNLALLLKQPLLKKTLLKKLAYYANGWHVFETRAATDSSVGTTVIGQYSFKNIESSNAKIVIVAKAHYRQSWKSYTSVSKKELEQILTLQKSNENSAATIFQVISNSAIDGYDIKKIIFDEKLLDELGEQRLLIPETEIFSLQEGQVSDFNNNQTWLTSLETPVGLLFFSSFADKGTSSYAKGLISNIETFKLSSGLPNDVTISHIDKHNYADYLFNCFTQKKVDLLYHKIAFNPKTWFNPKDLHLVYWAPLITASVFYLLANSYLWLQSYNIENELAGQGLEVSQLLDNKSQQDQQRQLLYLLNTEFSKTTTVHGHWSLVYRLVESDMTISRLSFTENVLSIRGKAPNASKVLADISNIPYVTRATFKGSVVKSRGLETFTIELVSNKKAFLGKVEEVVGTDKVELKTKETVER